MIADVVLAMRTKLPTIAHSTKLLGLVWLRLALNEVRLPLSSELIRRLFNWQTKSKISGLQVLRHRAEPNLPFRGNVQKLHSGPQVVGYRIEEFLSKRKFAYCEYSEEWKLKTVSLRVARAKLRSSAEKRSRQDVCGRELLERLEICVQSEANRKRECVLEQNPTEGGFYSKLSRAEMIKLLKKRYTRLQRYSDTTLMVALPEFVAFKKGRRKRVA